MKVSPDSYRGRGFDGFKTKVKSISSEPCYAHHLPISNNFPTLQSWVLPAHSLVCNFHNSHFEGLKAAEMETFMDYHSFGMQMPGRKYVNGDGYRYAFQGEEEDDELWGGAVSYKYRIEDPRLGRFFSVDPLSPKYPHYTPYSFSGNKLIAFKELEGLEEIEFWQTEESSEFASGKRSRHAFTADFYIWGGFNMINDDAEAFRKQAIESWKELHHGGTKLRITYNFVDGTIQNQWRNDKGKIVETEPPQPMSISQGLGFLYSRALAHWDGAGSGADLSIIEQHPSFGNYKNPGRYTKNFAEMEIMGYTFSDVYVEQMYGKEGKPTVSSFKFNPSVETNGMMSQTTSLKMYEFSNGIPTGISGGTNYAGRLGFYSSKQVEILNARIEHTINLNINNEPDLRFE